jgi:hypothetical protein
MAKIIDDPKELTAATDKARVAKSLHKSAVKLYGCVYSKATPPPRNKSEARAQIARMAEKKKASLDALAEL